MIDVDRNHYVGMSEEDLQSAKIALENTYHAMIAEITAHRAREEHSRVAEHADLVAALKEAAGEAQAAIAVVVDVIESGDSRESMEEQADINRLAAATRERQI